MNSFRIVIRDMTHVEKIDGVISFVGEDASGSFGIQANHARFISSLVYGLARFRQKDAAWQYLSIPGAMLYFVNNELRLNTRRFMLSDDYELMSHALLDVLATEEQELSAVKHNLHNIETNILHRLLDMRKPGQESL